MSPEWITAIASMIGVIGVLAVIFQAKAAFEQLDKSVQSLKADHERSRREMAIELLRHWDSSLTVNGAIARKFAESLNFETSKSLFMQQPFKIPNTHYGLFIGSLSPSSAQKRNEQSQEDNIEVSEGESSEIRWAVISYLNHLETILAAVRHNVADKDILYEQFTYLVSPSDDHYLLENFRMAARGGSTYPSIEAFANELKKEHNSLSSGKGLIA